MATIKSLDRISEKWLRASQASTVEYEQGVQSPRRSWADSASKAEANYNKGIQEAIAKGRFGKGVKLAGDSKWQNAALTKGLARWSAGITASRPNFEQGFAPYRTVIQNLVLPPRGPKGDPQNINRVTAVTTALRAEKLKRIGS